MLEELRYRWMLRKYLKDYILTKRVHALPVPEKSQGEPDIRHAQQKEQTIQEQEIGVLRSKYLIEQAYLYHVPIPEDDESWLNARYLGGEKFLTAEAAMKLRADIRNEQKANWDYWQNRVTLLLAVIGSIFGILAYFRR